MEISPLKKRIITAMFCLALLALAANIVFVKIYGSSVLAKESGFDKGSIERVFLYDLDNFGLKNDWIKKVNNKALKNVSSYQVELPKDLPIPVVLSEIFDSFYSSDIKIKSVEKTIGGKTVLDIYQQNILKLSAEFNYDEDIKRDAGDIGIIVFGLEQLNGKDINALIGYPQTFIAALVPSKPAVKFIPGLAENRKEYAILINDNISDLDYKLSNDFSSYRLKLIIRSIVADFSNAVFFIIDDRSKLYSSPAGKIIVDEFAKRNIKLISQSSLPEILNSSSTGIRDLFKRRVDVIHSGKSELISIRAEDFGILKPEIFSLIKVGYKFINPSMVIAANKSRE
jgi:hypothetical protein